MKESINILQSEMDCCNRKSVQTKLFNEIIYLRCKYCGFYSCVEKGCFYKNIEVRCMKKHYKVRHASYVNADKKTFPDQNKKDIDDNLQKHLPTIDKQTQTDN